MKKPTRIRLYFRHPTATGGKWEQQAGIQLGGHGAEAAMQMVVEAAYALLSKSGTAPEIAMVPDGVAAPSDDIVIESDAVTVRPGVEESKNGE